jgi:hypothetical protein
MFRIRFDEHPADFTLSLPNMPSVVIINFVMRILERIFGSKKQSPPDVLPGRNDQCWCGSNIKYKKCHLEEDQKPILVGNARCTTKTCSRA